jgi:hypothetical protein
VSDLFNCRGCLSRSFLAVAGGTNTPTNQLYLEEKKYEESFSVDDRGRSLRFDFPLATREERGRKKRNRHRASQVSQERKQD